MTTSPVTNTVSIMGNTSSNQVQSPSTTLGKDDFLQLLAAELKNQDPMNSTDNTQFISEMAQFSSLEQMTNVSQGIDGLQQEIAMIGTQFTLAQGATLIGKNVTGTDADGQQVQGVVSGVKWNNNTLELQIGDSSLNLSDVSSISSAS